MELYPTYSIVMCKNNKASIHAVHRRQALWGPLGQGGLSSRVLNSFASCLIIYSHPEDSGGLWAMECEI